MKKNEQMTQNIYALLWALLVVGILRSHLNLTGAILSGLLTGIVIRFGMSVLSLRKRSKIEKLSDDTVESEPFIRRRQQPLWETIVNMVFFTLVVIIVFNIRLTKLHDVSMQPTFYEGDVRIIVLTSRVEAGDIIGIRASEERQFKNYAKRVIAVEGDTIEIIDGRVYIDGELLEETYVERWRMEQMPPVTLKEDEIFVLGDNRSKSYDSRSFGPIKKGEVLGKILTWSPWD